METNAAPFPRCRQGTDTRGGAVVSLKLAKPNSGDAQTCPDRCRIRIILSFNCISQVKDGFSAHLPNRVAE